MGKRNARSQNLTYGAPSNARIKLQSAKLETRKPFFIHFDEKGVDVIFGKHYYGASLVDA